MKIQELIPDEPELDYIDESSLETIKQTKKTYIEMSRDFWNNVKENNKKNGTK